MQSWTLITGGAKGLGKEVAIALAKEGHNILLHYHTSHREAEIVARQCESLGVQSAIIKADFLSGVNDFIRVIQNKQYAISHIVNNVGNYLVKSALHTDEQEWRALIEANLTAPFLLVNAFVESIKSFQGGIVNIGVAGLNRFCADTYSPVYTMTKQGLLFLTKSLSKELAPFHVTVNMISPGHMENSVDIPHDLTTLPTGKLVSLKQVAEVVAFLLNKKNSQITGQNIEVAGAVRM